MAFRRRLDWVLVTALAATGVLAACSGGDETATASSGNTGGKSGGKAGSSAGGSAGSTGGSAGTAGSIGVSGQAGSIGVPNKTYTALALSPATATITFVNGAASPSATATFTAQATTSEGKTETLSTVTWAIDKTKLATIDKGVVTSAGLLGGEAVVTATQGTLTATAKVTVKIVASVAPTDDSIPPADQTTLRGATAPDAAVQLSYPYDKTVFPPGVLAPTLMWSPAGADDAYRAEVSSPFGAIEVFSKAADQRLVLPTAAWASLLRDSAGSTLSLKLSRLSAGQATVVSQQTWPVASAPLRGTVYYWANSIGRVMRIKPGATAPDDFLKDAGVTDGCTTCHVVSANGTRLLLGGATVSGDSNASVFDLATSTLTRTADQGYGRSWGMATLSPDGQYAVLNDAPLPGPPGGKGGGFYNVDSAQAVPGTSLDGKPVWMPAFSPDASNLVYVNPANGALAAYSYGQALLPADPFSNQRDLVPQVNPDPSGNSSAIAFPYPTPDGKWAVYHRGALDSREGLADLFLADMNTPGVEIPLANLNGATYPFVAGDRDRHYNYEPTFAPLPAGGYFWAIFTSRRTFGNKLTGAAVGGEQGQGVKQLWMAAIDLHPQPGVDPSHPAFLLEGQDLSTTNMRAFWAFDPCKPDGAGCEFGGDCCNGSCEPDAGGTLTCHIPEKPPECVQTGNKCQKSSDCCGAATGSECINGFCSDPGPGIH